ncbi:hypothetical protein [Flavitalea sp.]|nr:hypothetical protein [Flavitalea sp.]
MFKNYLKTAFKNLVKNRFYTSINIIGLATGLSVAILILLWVENEIGYDRFHTNANNIYRVLSNMGSGSSCRLVEGKIFAAGRY